MKKIVSPIALIAILATASATYAEGLFNLPYTQGEKRIELTDRVWPAAYGEAAVCIWKDDMLAPFSITIDDNWASDHPWWREVGEKYGFKVTWFMVTGGMDEEKAGFGGSWKLWRLNQEAGHDIQSHTVTHRNPKQDWPCEKDYFEAIGHIQENIPGSRVLTMAYPGGALPNDPSVAKKHFIAARGVGGGSNPVQNTDYYNTRVGIDFKEGSWNYAPNSLNPDAGQAFRAWRVYLFHGANTPDARRHFEKQFQYFRQSGKDWWMAPFTDVAKYGQARDTASLKVTRKNSNEIAFDLTSKMDTKIYDYPLSVKVRLDNSWNKLTATQAGKPVESKLVKHEGNIYALVGAVPGRGETVLTKQGEEKKYSNNAKLAKLEYCLDLPPADPEKDNMSPRISVPNFNPDTLEYKVTLPPGTPRATFYATTVDPSAVSQRTPHIGHVKPTAEEPLTATVTVTAEDETAKTYTIHFAVESFADIAKLAIDAPANLKQVTTSQHVDFTAMAQPEGTVDLTTIEWFVNDEKQEDAKGTQFRYTPRKYGTYTVQARAGKAQSEKRDIAFTKGAAKPGVVILDENFSRHAVGKPVPTSSNASDNKLTDPAGTYMDRDWRINDDSLKIAEFDGRKVAAWTTDNNKSYATLTKRHTVSGTEPIAVAFKVRIENDSKNLTRTPFMFHLGSVGAGLGHSTWEMMGNGQFKGFMPSWDALNPKWISVVVAYDLEHHNGPGSGFIYEGTYIGNELHLGNRWEPGAKGATEFMTRTTWRNRHHFPDGKDMHAVFTFGGGPENPANYGKFSNYLADVKVYRPGSLVMTPAKPAFAANEPVRMNFSHHVNINTLRPETVKVTDSKGAPVRVDSLATDPMNFDFFVINFPGGALKKGETYTVALDETVRDVIDKTAYDVATFTIN